MAKKKVVKKKPTIFISIHIKDGMVLDVAGIPKGTEVIVTDVDTLDETTYTQEDNCQ